MDKKKALLILVGGRASIPNILTAIHEKPDIIVALCSKESRDKEWLDLKPAITSLLPACYIREAKPINAFEIGEIQDTCEQEVKRCPDADWIFNVTTATSLMTLGAYKAAENLRQQYNTSIKCWYLNTANTRVINLVGEGRDEEIFSITVDQYVRAHNYELRPGNLKDHQESYQKDHCIAIAKRLGKNPQEAYLLKQIMNTLGGSPKKSESGKEEILKGYKLEKHTSQEMYSLLQDLEYANLLSGLRRNDLTIQFRLSERQYAFLNGAWLELYVYIAAKELGIFHDCAWSKIVIDNHPERKGKKTLEYNELDVSMTYKAQLLAIECKTGKAGFDEQTLKDIVNIADLLGGKFVGKLLATIKSSDDEINPDKEMPFNEFFTKADKRGIYVVPREKLPNIDKYLYELATNSKYSRG